MFRCLQASLSNIPPKSALLVVHVISVWVMSLFTWWVSSDPSLMKTSCQQQVGETSCLTPRSAADSTIVLPASCTCELRGLLLMSTVGRTIRRAASSTALPSAAQHLCHNACVAAAVGARHA